MQLNIKKSNYWAIHDWAVLNQSNRIQGSKLIALIALIDKKGEPLKTSYKDWKGVKAIEYSHGCYVAIKKEISNISETKIKILTLTQLSVCKN
jgi:hypothetical protein